MDKITKLIEPPRKYSQKWVEKLIKIITILIALVIRAINNSPKQIPKSDSFLKAPSTKKNQDFWVINLKKWLKRIVKYTGIKWYFMIPTLLT